MNRFIRVWLVVATLCASWLGAMFVHEAGHVLHAWVSGGQVERMVLHPLRFSRTDVSPNPHPLFVVWGGAVWGVVIPVMLWLAVVWGRRRWAYLLRFFAGACAVVNGAYIGVGWTIDAGDAGVMRALGTPVWVMVLFGTILCALGLWAWHGLGTRFARGTPREAAGATVVLVTLVVAGLLA